MRSFIHCLALSIALLISTSISAQSTSITSIIDKGEKTELTITSDRGFYIGGNTHILHIGKKDFSLSKQNNKAGTGTIIFYIPTEEFNALREGEEVFMTYGTKVRRGTEENLEDFCKKNPKVAWYLGKFSKTL